MIFLRELSLRIHTRLREQEYESGRPTVQERAWRLLRRIGHRLLKRQPPVLVVLDGPAELSGYAAITGWVAARQGPVKWVEAIVDGQVMAAGPPTEWRPDAVDRFPSFRFHGPVGFRLAPPPGLLPDGLHRLLLRAHDGRGRTAELGTILEIHDYRIPDGDALPTHLRGSNREYQAWLKQFDHHGKPLSLPGERGWGEGVNSAQDGPLPPHPRPLSPKGARGDLCRPFSPTGATGDALSQSTIDIVMPIYRPHPNHLREAIDSVRGQTHSRWVLCLCDDGSSQPELTRFLQDLAEADSRIRFVAHSHNRGIAEATNAAIRLGVGDYVAFLDQDDRLHAEALQEVAPALDADQADWLYTDEDRIDEHGCRVEPFFKPDWSPDLLTSMMYAAHLSVYRRAFLNGIGLCRPGFDGGQDWELALRAASATDRITHVPKVLYHWRKGGHSAGPRFNRACHERGRRAIGEYLRRLGVTADVTDGPNGCTFHVRYRHDRQPLVSILIPTRDRLGLLSRCLRSIRRRTKYANYEIIVMDNGSRDPRLLRFLRRWAGKGGEGEAPAEPRRWFWRSAGREPRPPGRRVLRLDMPFNHSRLNNLAARQARGELLLLLNDDTAVINSEWLTALVEQALRPEVGAGGGLLLHPDGRIQHAGVVLGLGPVATPLHSGITRDGLDRGTLRLIRNVSAITGACLMIRKSLFFEMGGLDEEDLPASFNDVDLCLRLGRAGYRIVCTPLARLYHQESASRGFEDEELYIRIMQERWSEELERDPFWSPNLPHGPQPHSGFAFQWDTSGSPTADWPMSRAARTSGPDGPPARIDQSA